MVRNLKTLRQKHGITQQCLAAAIGVTQQSINKYENHSIEPDVDTLIAMAEFFQTTVDYLVGHTHEQEEGITLMQLCDDEIRLLSRYRSLSLKEKESIQMILDNYCK